MATMPDARTDERSAPSMSTVINGAKLAGKSNISVARQQANAAFTLRPLRRSSG